jgi:hypothetical protein
MVDSAAQAKAIINDLNELCQFGYLTICRCSLDGVFDKAASSGSHYFETLANSFGAETSSRTSCDLLNSFRNSYLKLYSGHQDQPLATIFRISCDRIRDEYETDVLRQKGFISSLPFAAKSIISGDNSNETDSTISKSSSEVPQKSVTYLTKRPRITKREVMMRRRRSRQLDPNMQAAGLIVAPKGVYTTKTKTYRVQLNLRDTNFKFSKNVETLEEALWLYEIKVLTSDNPQCIDNLLYNGNYESFVELGILETKTEYHKKLGEQITRLSRLGSLNNLEEVAAWNAYRTLTF